MENIRKKGYTMLKKLAIATLLTFSTSVMAMNYGQPSSSNTVSASIVNNDLYKNSVTLLNMSSSLLKMSQTLLQMQQNGQFVNTDYVNSMLRLSDNIGTMADRILATEKEIGAMSDRILETQRIQNENVALTQKNILSAQQNLSAILKAPNGCNR